MERMAAASFHTPSLGDEPSYQAVKTPTNPLSPYAFFFKETQTSIKQQQPDANFESVSKIVETMWQSLDEAQKEKYKKMNEADKERYFREKEAYERITGQVFPVSKVLKRSLSTLVFFFYLRSLVFFFYLRSLCPPTHQMLCKMLQVPPGASELVAVGQVSGTPSGRTSTAATNVWCSIVTGCSRTG